MDNTRNNLLTRDEIHAEILVYFNVVDINSDDELVKGVQRLAASK